MIQNVPAFTLSVSFGSPDWIRRRSRFWFGQTPQTDDPGVGNPYGAGTAYNGGGGSDQPHGYGYPEGFGGVNPQQYSAIGNPRSTDDDNQARLPGNGMLVRCAQSGWLVPESQVVTDQMGRKVARRFVLRPGFYEQNRGDMF